MDAHPAPPGHEPDDLVSRYRGAAVRQTNQQIVETLDVHPDLRIPAEAVSERVGLGLGVLTPTSAADPLRNGTCRLMAFPDRSEAILADSDPGI
ncbi:MAG: hypothetical protein ACO3NQ_06380, partial [Ilumatobacteraceae bacterium]